jgi:hypothetical protein
MNTGTIVSRVFHKIASFEHELIPPCREHTDGGGSHGRGG